MGLRLSRCAAVFVSLCFGNTPPGNQTSRQQRGWFLQIPSVLVWLAMHRKHLATLEVNAGYHCVGCVVAMYNLPLWSQGDPSGVMTAKVCQLWRQITRGFWGQDQFLLSSSLAQWWRLHGLMSDSLLVPVLYCYPPPFPAWRLSYQILKMWLSSLNRDLEVKKKHKFIGGGDDTVNNRFTSQVEGPEFNPQHPPNVGLLALPTQRAPGLRETPGSALNEIAPKWWAIWEMALEEMCH